MVYLGKCNLNWRRDDRFALVEVHTHAPTLAKVAFATGEASYYQALHWATVQHYLIWFAPFETITSKLVAWIHYNIRLLHNYLKHTLFIFLSRPFVSNYYANVYFAAPLVLVLSLACSPCLELSVVALWGASLSSLPVFLVAVGLLLAVFPFFNTFQGLLHRSLP